jgi:hypothetical protein
MEKYFRKDIEAVLNEVTTKVTLDTTSNVITLGAPHNTLFHIDLSSNTAFTTPAADTLKDGTLYRLQLHSQVPNVEISFTGSHEILGFPTFQKFRLELPGVYTMYGAVYGSKVFWRYNYKLAPDNGAKIVPLL